MSTFIRLTVGAVALGAPLLLAAPASAQSCDYPFDCAVADNQVVTGSSDVRPAAVGSSANGPATLPFTGGEVTLISLVGLGALGAGTAMVIAGRRRETSA